MRRILLSCGRFASGLSTSAPPSDSTHSFDVIDELAPISVNYHFTRACNFRCTHCFHSQIPSARGLLPIDEAKEGLSLLRDEGMEKITLTGGEPFLHPVYLMELLRFCKDDLSLMTSVITNGSLLSPDILASFSPFIDLIGISMDSFSAKTVRKMGRTPFDVDCLSSQLAPYRDTVDLKINTVVTSLNVHEDMTTQISSLSPSRWKVLQVTPVKYENETTYPSVEVSLNDFEDFVLRHESLNPVVEQSEIVKDSYLKLDERMRFLNGETQEYGESILDVGVRKAVESCGFNARHFLERGGDYFLLEEE